MKDKLDTSLFSSEFTSLPIVSPSSYNRGIAEEIAFPVSRCWTNVICRDSLMLTLPSKSKTKIRRWSRNLVMRIRMLVPLLASTRTLICAKSTMSRNRNDYSINCLFIFP